MDCSPWKNKGKISMANGLIKEIQMLFMSRRIGVAK